MIRAGSVQYLSKDRPRVRLLSTNASRADLKEIRKVCERAEAHHLPHKDEGDE